jgi:hypothetical protein
MGKCKHPARVWLWWVCDDMQYAYFTAQRAKGLGWSWFGRGLGDPHARWCAACGAWLSLGPARDTPEVCVEIRAAELAVLGHAWWDAREYESESYGVLCFHNGGTPGDDDDGGCSYYADAEWAGYLARCIATHDTAREGSGE